LARMSTETTSQSAGKALDTDFVPQNTSRQRILKEAAIKEEARGREIEDRIQTEFRPISDRIQIEFRPLAPSTTQINT